MAELIRPDICVIGAGYGGRAVAAAAAALGVAVVLIERRRMGAESVDGGSVPSQALVAAARRSYAADGAAAFGAKAQRGETDFARLRDHVQAAMAALAPSRSKERFIGLGVRVIEGTARFRDR